jgi:predicted esterase
VSPRFFCRLAEGVFEIEDLKFRTNELADFVERASTVYGFYAKKVMAIGHPNGANIAAAFSCSGLIPVLSSGVLFRAMVQLVSEASPDLTRKHIFMSSRICDPIVSKQEAERLFGLFKNAGANISFSWQESGHK